MIETTGVCVNRASGLPVGGRGAMQSWVRYFVSKTLWMCGLRRKSGFVRIFLFSIACDLLLMTAAGAARHYASSYLARHDLPGGERMGIDSRLHGVVIWKNLNPGEDTESAEESIERGGTWAGLAVDPSICCGWGTQADCARPALDSPMDLFRFH